MTNYTKLSVNFISLVISIIIFCLIDNFSIAVEKINVDINNNSNQVSSIEVKSNNIDNNAVENKIITNNTNNAVVNIKKENGTIVKKDFEWQIEIPSISLKAEIAEGTSKDVMNKYIGHFSETSNKTGNIGLAAHNRGYKVNYFENLKKLKENDKVIYKYKDFQKTYYVKKIKIIKDTDWTYLENTEENVITLITCIENEPEYRRCVQAVERK